MHQKFLTLLFSFSAYHILHHIWHHESNVVPQKWNPDLQALHFSQSVHCIFLVQALTCLHGLLFKLLQRTKQWSQHKGQVAKANSSLQHWKKFNLTQIVNLHLCTDVQKIQKGIAGPVPPCFVAKPGCHQQPELQQGLKHSLRSPRNRKTLAMEALCQFPKSNLSYPNLH